MKNLVSPLAALALIASVSAPLNAEIIRHHEGSYAVVESSQLPRAGLSKQDVLARYGEPVHRHGAVGTPSISSWEYAGFQVYFEHQTVLHTVIKVAGR